MLLVTRDVTSLAARSGGDCCFCWLEYIRLSTGHSKPTVGREEMGGGDKRGERGGGGGGVDLHLAQIMTRKKIVMVLSPEGT